MRWVFNGVTAHPGGGQQFDSDGAGGAPSRPNSRSCSPLFCSVWRALAYLCRTKRTPFHICTHGSTARAHSQRNPTTALDTHHRSARSGSQGIKSPCSSAALMHTHTPAHACTLKCCHFSTYHLSSKSWTVKSIRVLQVIVLPDTHELSS